MAEPPASAKKPPNFGPDARAFPQPGQAAQAARWRVGDHCHLHRVGNGQCLLAVQPMGLGQRGTQALLPNVKFRRIEFTAEQDVHAGRA